MAKRKRGGRSGGGGRYTPPKRSTEPVAPAQQVETFAQSLRRQDRELRARCAALLEEPPTNTEWVEADLAGMDGFDATDEELVGFWSAYRRSIELDPEMEPPDLRMVMDCLERGEDPAAAVSARFDSLDE